VVTEHNTSGNNSYFIPSVYRYHLIFLPYVFIKISQEYDFVLCCISSVEQSNTNKFHYRLVAQGLYLLYNAPTCFGHTFGHLQGATIFIDLHDVYGNLSQMTANNLWHVALYAEHDDQTCNSLKTAKYMAETCSSLAQ
jgi:hypothetical protein